MHICRDQLWQIQLWPYCRQSEKTQDMNLNKKMCWLDIENCSPSTTRALHSLLSSMPITEHLHYSSHWACTMVIQRQLSVPLKEGTGQMLRLCDSTLLGTVLSTIHSPPSLTPTMSYERCPIISFLFSYGNWDRVGTEEHFEWKETCKEKYRHGMGRREM